MSDQEEIVATLQQVLESMERCSETGSRMKRQKTAIDSLAENIEKAITVLQEARAVDQKVIAIIGELLEDDKMPQHEREREE